jgi:ribosomal protein L11 methyltransferase
VNDAPDAGTGAPESTGELICLVLTVPVDEAELAADRLWECGAGAVEERSVIDTGDASGSGGAGGAVELWTSLGRHPERMVGERLRLEADWRWRTVPVETTHAETWREHVQPVEVAGRLVVVPAWREDLTPRDGRLALSIEPGGAFGLGDHPTTVLSLAALLETLEASGAVGTSRSPGEVAYATGRPPAMPDRIGRPPSVLDVGCGSGVLAIAAARLGASPVRAIDIAPVAIEATIDNARRNGVAASIVADHSPCADVPGSFDVVLANILAPTLIALADDLRRLTAVDGRLIVSGVLGERHDHVLAALAPMVVDRIAHRAGWAAITLRHR